MTLKTDPDPVEVRDAVLAGIASLNDAKEAAAGCRACRLWLRGTQTVFGEGRERARLLFVGEQPGDREDIAGRPFVGPAGRVLDEALDAAGIDRRTVYLTTPRVMATVHPSSIIRITDSEGRRAEMERFVEDLRVAASHLNAKSK